MATEWSERVAPWAVAVLDMSVLNSCCLCVQMGMGMGMMGMRMGMMVSDPQQYNAT